MQRRLVLTLAPLALAALAFAAPAAAQPAPPPPGAPMPPGPHMMMRGGGMEGMRAMHEKMIKQHADDLRTILRLRPDQESALQAFLAARQPMMGHGQMAGGPMPGGPMPGGPMAGAPMPGMDDGPKTTPERLDAEARREAAMTAQREKMRVATSRFYAALSPDQQKVFDAVMRMRAGPHGGGPMGGKMGGHDGGGMERRIIIRRGEAPPPPARP